MEERESVFSRFFGAEIKQHHSPTNEERGGGGGVGVEERDE